MPELPEVETIVKYLRKYLINKKINAVGIICPKLIKKPAPIQLFKKIVTKKPISEIRRLGKFIIIEFKSKYLLALHLKMTGNLLYTKSGFLKPPACIWFKLNNNHFLTFTDIRKFGRLYAGTKRQLLSAKPFMELAPDPLTIGFNEFKKRLTSKKSVVKQALIDQTKIVSGIGNIYANEILWQAKIHPLRQIRTLTHKEMKILYREIKKVLKLAIKTQGSTMRNYRKPNGTTGNYQKIRRVYARKNLRCFRCKTPIHTIKINNRSSFFCPKCQHI